MHASVVEVGTKVCRDINEARAEVTSLRANIAALANENGLRLLPWNTSFHSLG
jgi:carboxylate-amine ligase